MRHRPRGSHHARLDRGCSTFHRCSGPLPGRTENKRIWLRWDDSIAAGVGEKEPSTGVRYISRSKLLAEKRNRAAAYLAPFSILRISFSNAASTLADWRSPRATRLT